jgi:glycine cleavage system H protein
MQRFYTDTHEWLRLDGDTALIGISRFAQQELGEIVYVGMPNADQVISAGGELCVLESLKAAADVYAPVNLTVLETNPLLTTNPGLINEDPENHGWLVRVRLLECLNPERLLAPEQYFALLG